MIENKREIIIEDKPHEVWGEKRNPSFLPGRKHQNIPPARQNPPHRSDPNLCLRMDGRKKNEEEIADGKIVQWKDRRIENQREQTNDAEG